MKSNLVMYTARQRTKEFSQSQYIGSIDLLAAAEDQNQSLKEIKTAAVEFYTATAPALLDGVRAVDNTLASILAQGEATNDLLRHANAKLDNIDESLIRIEDILGWGFDLIAIRLDESNRLLTAIRDILSAPVATQAAEYLGRGQDFITDGFYEEANGDLTKVVELDPGNYVAWYLIGLLRSQAFGDKEGALEAFAKSDRFSSVRSKEYYSKSQFQQALISYNVDSDLLATKKHLLQAINADQGNLNAHFFAAELYSELGEVDASIKHLRRCEISDESFYFRSYSSSSLQASGVHDRVFTDRTSEFVKFNQSLLNAIRTKKKSLFEKLSEIGYQESSLSSLAGYLQELNGAAPRDNYLAQRKLFRVSESLISGIPSKLDRCESWVRQWVDEPKKELTKDLSAIKSKEEDDFATRLTIIAGSILAIPALLWIGLAIIEIVKAFRGGIIEGVFITIGIVLGTVLLGILFVVGWGVVTGIVALVLKGFGAASTHSKANSAQKRKEQTAKYRDDIASVVYQEINGFRTDLARGLT